MYNYGQLQVTFENGSVGWYESGWGPMISETAYFVKDVFTQSKSCQSLIYTISNQFQIIILTPGAIPSMKRSGSLSSFP